MADGVNTNGVNTMSGLLGVPNDVGGELTEDEFWEATAKIISDSGVRPGFMVFSKRTLELGRDAALAAAGVANWCWAREAEMPRWAWRRRARWRAAGIKAARDAEGFWGTFGTGDVL